MQHFGRSEDDMLLDYFSALTYCEHLPARSQIDVTSLGRIARLSSWYEGSTHDGTIYEDNYDGEPVVGDKAYIGKPRCVTANRGQVSPAQELRNQVLPLPLCPLFSSRV